VRSQDQVDPKTRLAWEISNGFEDLSKKVSASTLDGTLRGVLDIFRVICIRLGQMDSEEREDTAREISEALEGILTDLAKKGEAEKVLKEDVVLKGTLELEARDQAQKRRRKRPPKPTM